MSSEAQACWLCSSSICSEHRILLGSVGYKDNKAQGGINCQCRNAAICMPNQLLVRQFLGVPAIMEPKGKGGKSKVKGKGKAQSGKGKSKRGSSSSSSSVWRPQ